MVSRCARASSIISHSRYSQSPVLVGGTRGLRAAHARIAEGPAAKLRHHAGSEKPERMFRLILRKPAPREGQHQVIAAAPLEKICDLVRDSIRRSDNRGLVLAREVQIVAEMRLDGG